MKIEIIAPTRIEVDGVDAGTVMAFARAHPELHVQIDQAFVDWHASHIKATAKADADRDAAIDKARSETVAAMTDRDSAQATVAAAHKLLSEHPAIAGDIKAHKLREAQARAKEAADALKALES